ncbi:MAG TPA: L-threonylcarbamoyladenylate synthase [Acholeplasmataceae bacterium]|jgi:L-threonylcarbamoyladenylate synthase|nr:threonylcarbamoyl-AMP synthase [Acholeplasmataceae bacterium]HPX72171.1 L-threonylcarbamoyladenylate synthase [Acholeplasmataceae bacterium]HQC31013.1 L-threonylcarbamoyladenylate synthase [Acholeplasmataceae bacterium]
MEKGQVIIFPTDTIYGMGCQLYDKVALERIYEIKKRSHDKDIPVLVSSIVQINVIAKYDSKALRIMQNFWPGPLTLILQSTPDFYNKTGDKTIAIRIPDHYVTIELINNFGPLRTTSVNISGEEPLNKIEDIRKQYGNVVDHIYGEHVGHYIGIASTIVDISNGSIKLVREGAIPFEDILAVYNK